MAFLGGKHCCESMALVLLKKFHPIHFFVSDAALHSQNNLGCLSKLKLSCLPKKTHCAKNEDLTMCFYLSTCFFQACKMSCQSSCVGVLWRQPSAMWRVTQRASCSAAKTTAGAGARPDSQNATVPSPTSRSWKRTWTRANRPGAGSTKSS